jgi:hypothetical protein
MMELMIVLAIIAILCGLAFAALHHVKNSGDVVAERAMVVTCKQGVEQFRQQFGFLPALVVDAGDPQAPVHIVPPGTDVKVLVWPTQELSNPYTTLNLSPGTDPPLIRNCYSVYSLPYYLAGSLGFAADEVSGYGCTAPTRDGQFSGTGRKYDPFVDPTRFKTRGGLVRAFTMLPSGTSPPGNTEPGLTMYYARTVILDRWSDGSGFTNGNDRAIRYYRWEPSFYTPAGGTDPNPAKVGQIHYWNVPIAVGGDPNDPTAPPKNADLKTATWAIVSAGPDRFFGDELSLTTPAQRAAAAADNIVEVGR